MKYSFPGLAYIVLMVCTASDMVSVMRIVLQKVSEASVSVPDNPDFVTQSIGTGYMLLIGVSDTDGDVQIEWLARKIANLRVFEDEQGKMNRSIADVHGEILSISQFTLYGNAKKGNRPSFIDAGAPDHAKSVWLTFNERLRDHGLTVKEGEFGAHMDVALINDGPVTILFDSEQLGI